MGQITVEKDGFSFNVNIAGDQPTEDEVAKIRSFMQSEQFSAFKEKKQTEQAPAPEAMTEAPAAPSVAEDPMGPSMLLPETAQQQPSMPPKKQIHTLNRLYTVPQVLACM